ncbi:hypothetical protein [Nocardia sp. NBC_01009]|uniref:hypothetical protein n=1 Tax=Nocardia sp. NBC_01009 TaxID=2975996 RepID=UPI003867C6F8|nr:hypothetical protein OHA42_25530 [Nocardia sp. NBC_01009]
MIGGVLLAPAVDERNQFVGHVGVEVLHFVQPPRGVRVRTGRVDALLGGGCAARTASSPE